LYQLRHDPKNPVWLDLDRVVLDKGHAVPAQYAALAHAGYFAREELWKLRRLGATLQGHPVNYMTAGIEACTGSLGQGLSVAQGMAMASKLNGGKFHVWTMIGDGEMQEGQIWEAAMSAAKYKLDTLTCILDYNKGQIDGPVKDVMPIEPIADKWKAFGWHVIQINGHDFGQILDAFAEATRTKGKPTFILADTVKGKAVSFMEDRIEWHGATPNPEQAQKAIEEIKRS
ncbi:MAG: transketolase, partial [Myxococcales bacterium]